jgi:large subunit ribosomal protein L17
MRKMVFGRKFSRGRKGRIALFRSLIRAMILNGKIVTTIAKAKAIKKDLDKYITKAKKNTIAARRKVLAEMGNDREAVDALFMKVAPAFNQRNSGFSRITLLPKRKGDASKMVRLEWSDKIVEKEVIKKEESKKKEKPLIKEKKVKKVKKVNKK